MEVWQAGSHMANKQLNGKRMDGFRKRKKKPKVPKKAYLGSYQHSKERGRRESYTLLTQDSEAEGLNRP